MGAKYINQLISLRIITLVILAAGESSSVIMPPRLYSHMPAPAMVNEEPPYQLTIVNGDSIDVATSSKSSFVINLNRAAPIELSVSVKVYSGPGLVTFDNNASNETTIKYEFDTFGDRVVNFLTSARAGHAEIVCKIMNQPNATKIDDSTAYVSVNIGKSSQLDVLIAVVGWLYFAAWSLSFYPQVILNYRRKSVVGLNFDFLALNLFGFACYTVYNFSLMFSRQAQHDYYERNSYSRIPVEVNDLFFALHAFTLTLVTVLQCFLYERGGQRVSIAVASFIGLASMLGFSLYVVHIFNKILVLDLLLYLSYVKLTVTLVKYTPQAYMNYQRRATTGWSIHNILLDFTGGLFSISQMFLIAYNYDDWISIFGNFTKFGLGFFSIAFDVLFVIQHYVLYNKQDADLEDSNDSGPSPVISQSIRSVGCVPPIVDGQEA